MCTVHYFNPCFFRSSESSAARLHGYVLWLLLKSNGATGLYFLNFLLCMRFFSASLSHRFRLPCVIITWRGMAKCWKFSFRGHGTLQGRGVLLSRETPWTLLQLQHETSI